MQYPAISIVTPSYNQGHFLEQTILSVIGQNYPRLEYIIIDGGSTDNSAAIIKKYEEKLHYWISEKDNGQSHAINKGFGKAGGDILMWLNSDDLLLPGVLHYIADTVVNAGEGIYFGNCIHFSEKVRGVDSWGSDVVGSHQKHSLEHIDYIIQPSSFWNRSVFEKAGPLSEVLHFGFDWEWFLRAKKMGVAFKALNKSISMYRFHDNHKSGTGGRKRQEELLSIYKMYSPKLGELFHLLMDEEKDFNGVKAKTIKKIYSYSGRGLSYGRLLKYMKGKKYKEFTAEEINYSCYML